MGGRSRRWENMRNNTYNIMSGHQKDLPEQATSKLGVEGGEGVSQAEAREDSGYRE